MKILKSTIQPHIPGLLAQLPGLSLRTLYPPPPHSSLCTTALSHLLMLVSPEHVQEATRGQTGVYLCPTRNLGPYMGDPGRSHVTQSKESHPRRASSCLAHAHAWENSTSHFIGCFIGEVREKAKPFRTLSIVNLFASSLMSSMVGR